MNRNWLVPGACMLMLAGCAHLASRQMFPAHYTLTVPPPSTQRNESSETEQGATLQIARVTVAPWLQGTELYYRLDYRHDNRIAAYARSDWVAPPARLLQPMIRNALADGNTWRAVTGPADPARADFSLHIRLDDFSQVFASPQQSDGALDATATLVDNHDGSAISQKHFHIRTPAPTPDAEGGVKALDQAALQFIGDLEQWLRRAPRHPDSPTASPAGGPPSRR